MIKWVKFFETDTHIVKTLYTETGFFQDDGETHDYIDAQDAVAKSENDVVIFWDNKYIGKGIQQSVA